MTNSTQKSFIVCITYLRLDSFNLIIGKHVFVSITSSLSIVCLSFSEASIALRFLCVELFISIFILIVSIPYSLTNLLREICNLIRDNCHIVLDLTLWCSYTVFCFLMIFRFIFCMEVLLKLLETLLVLKELLAYTSLLKILKHLFLASVLEHLLLLHDTLSIFLKLIESLKYDLLICLVEKSSSISTLSLALDKLLSSLEIWSWISEHLSQSTSVCSIHILKKRVREVILSLIVAISIGITSSQCSKLSFYITYLSRSSVSSNVCYIGIELKTFCVLESSASHNSIEAKSELMLISILKSLFSRPIESSTSTYASSFKSITHTLNHMSSSHEWRQCYSTANLNCSAYHLLKRISKKVCYTSSKILSEYILEMLSYLLSECILDILSNVLKGLSYRFCAFLERFDYPILNFSHKSAFTFLFTILVLNLFTEYCTHSAFDKILTEIFKRIDGFLDSTYYAALFLSINFLTKDELLELVG